MKKLRNIVLVALLLSFGIYSSCDENGDFVIFSIQNDKDLGEQVKGEIESDPTTYPILDRATYGEAYGIEFFIQKTVRLFLRRSHS